MPETTKNRTFKLLFNGRIFCLSVQICTKQLLLSCVEFFSVGGRLFSHGVPVLHQTQLQQNTENAFLQLSS